MYYINIIYITKFKEFEIFLWKKDAFDCAGIRAQVFRLPVETWAQIPAQSKASFFPQKDFKFFKFEFNLHLFAM